jgi:hypothetical protein
MEPEAKTRAIRIDPQLKAAGWTVTPFDPAKPLSSYHRAAVKEYETENGPADYALCDGGRVLAVVEAKKLTLGPAGVLTQAARYLTGGDDLMPLVSAPDREPFKPYIGLNFLDDHLQEDGRSAVAHVTEVTASDSETRVLFDGVELDDPRR